MATSSSSFSRLRDSEEDGRESRTTATSAGSFSTTASRTPSSSTAGYGSTASVSTEMRSVRCCCCGAAIKRVTWDDVAVPVVFFVFVVMRSLDRVFYKRVGDRMAAYQTIFSNIIWTIGVQVGTIVLCIGWVLWKRCVLKDKRYGWSFFCPRSAISTSSGAAVGQWRLVGFALFDQVSNLGTSLPSPFISQVMQGIFSNFSIVWTAVLSFVLLGSRYRQPHIIGCVLVLLSGIVSIVVELQSGEGLDEYKDATGEMRTSSPWWYIMYIAFTIPNAMSNVWKQHCMQSLDLEIMYATYWSGWWQILIGIVLFPVQWIPMPEPAPHVEFLETPTSFANAFLCFVGIAPSDAPLDQACAAAGGSALVWFLVYLVFCVTFNCLLLWLTKRLSALWAAIGTVLCLDLASLFSMSTFLMGDEAELLTLEQYLGLILAGIGLWTYNLFQETRLGPNGEQVEALVALDPAARKTTLAASFVQSRSNSMAVVRPSMDFSFSAERGAVAGGGEAGARSDGHGGGGGVIEGEAYVGVM